MSLSPCHKGVKSGRSESGPKNALAGLLGRLAGDPPGPGPLLVAVSGGGDSVGLLRLLDALAPEYGWRLTVAHVNHGLRPEADMEADFVRKLAGDLGHGFILHRVGPIETGLSLEEACRRARHDWMARKAAELGAKAIALGHTLDDQAETLLCRALSGSGPTGLAGMRPNRGLLWRPLLHIRRRELREYLLALDQGWQSDSSNQDLGPLRNRVRHAILPPARELINPRADEALGRLAAILQDEEDYWQSLCKMMWSAHGRRQGISYLLDNEAQNLHPAALGRLMRWLTGHVLGSGQHLLAGHMEQLLRLWSGGPGRELTLPLGLCAYREHGGLRLSPDTKPVDFSTRLDKPGSVELGQTGQRLLVENGHTPEALKSAGDLAWLPAERFDWPLTVRPPQSGDVFQAMGSPGKKRLNRFLIDRKVPPWLRPRIPLVCDHKGILWVAGVAVSERARKKLGQGAWICARLIDRNRDHAYTETPYNE